MSAAAVTIVGSVKTPDFHVGLFLELFQPLIHKFAGLGLPGHFPDLIVVVVGIKSPALLPVYPFQYMQSIFGLSGSSDITVFRDIFKYLGE